MAPLSRYPCRSVRITIIVVRLHRVWVAQRPQPLVRDEDGEAVAAQYVEVAVLEPGQSGDVLVPDLVTLGAELGDRDIDVSGRPKRDGVQDQGEGAELVLHSVPICLVDGPLPAVADIAGELVPGFLDGELIVHLAPTGVVHGAEDGQEVQGLGDPPILGERGPEWGGVALAAEHPQQVVGCAGPSRSTTTDARKACRCR